MTLLFRLAITFLIGGLVSSAVFVYASFATDELEEHIEMLTWKSAFYDASGIQAARRASEITIQNYRFVSYVNASDSETLARATRSYISLLMRTWSFMTGPGVSSLSEIRFANWDGAEIFYDEQDQLEDMRATLARIIPEVLGISLTEFIGLDMSQTIGGREDDPAIVRKLERHISEIDPTVVMLASLETFDQLLVIQRAYKRFAQHFAEINQLNLKEFNSYHKWLPMILVAIFVGQFGIFVITGYVDLFVIRMTRASRKYHFRMTLACLAAVCSGLGFTADQILIQTESYQNQLSLSHVRQTEEFRTRQLFEREIRDITLKWSEAHGGLVNHIRTGDVNEVAKYVAYRELILLPDLVEHLRSGEYFQLMELNQREAFMTLSNHVKKLNDIFSVEIDNQDTATQIQEQILQYWIRNGDELYSLLVAVQNALSVGKNTAYDQANETYFLIGDLGERSLLLIVTSVVLQAISLFCILMILREDPETPI